MSDTVRLSTPLTIVGVGGYGGEPIDMGYDGNTGQPVYRASSDRTFILAGAMPWGEVTISATADGPHARDLAMAQALRALAAVKPGVTFEHHELLGGGWLITSRAQQRKEDAMSDSNVTTLKFEPTPSPVDQVIEMVDTDSISAKDLRRLRNALADLSTRDAGNALGALGALLGGGKKS